MSKKKTVARGSKATSDVDMEGPKMDFKSILKDIEYLGSSHMTWKERKELENRKVVSLGGKPPKKQRLPLSVARVQMKKQKERDEKMLEESLVLGRFGGSHVTNMKKQTEKRRPEHRALKATEGHFRNGVLDVKHLLRTSTSSPADDCRKFFTKGKTQKGGKKGGKKGKKGGKKRR